MFMQLKTWMTTFIYFFLFFIFFKRSIPSGISLTNRHLLILDGHGSHVTLEAIEQVKFFGLDMVILPLHTSWTLQPLGVACFKPLKTIFRKEINITMVRRNDTKPYKITILGLVDKVINLTLTRKIYHVMVQRYGDLAT
jgi:hypothetical protein